MLSPSATNRRRRHSANAIPPGGVTSTQPVSPRQSIELADIIAIFRASTRLGRWIDMVDQAQGDAELRAKQDTWAGFCRVMLGGGALVAILLILMAVFLV